MTRNMSSSYKRGRASTEYIGPSFHTQTDHKKDLELKVTIRRELQSVNWWRVTGQGQQTTTYYHKQQQHYQRGQRHSATAKRHEDKMGMVGFLGKPSDFYIPCKGPLCKELTTCWSHPSPYKVLMTRLYSACTQRNYMCMCIFQCWTHPIGEKQGTYS